MDFDWTTFTLEIINFLILIWILKRFLYKPVLDIIARRRVGIEKTLADAQRIKTEADEFKQQNKQYLAEWEAEKETARVQLTTELAAVRESKLAELEAQITQEATRRRVLDERRRRDLERMLEEKGVAQGAAFSSKLFSRLASPELETSLYTLLLEDLHCLRKEDKHEISEAAAIPELKIKVYSAFPLEDSRQTELSRVLTELVGRVLPIDYHEQTELISGFQIDIGPWVLHANLRDELKFFSGALQHVE